jgi:predicted nucleic acid-binding protein
VDGLTCRPVTSTFARSAKSGVDSCHVADYMLDTAFFIDLRRNTSGANDFLRTIEAASVSGSYSAVTAYELWVGRGFSREEEVFYQAAFPLLEDASITASAAMSAGATLRQSGNRTEKLFRDALIAASAQERKEVVVTRNVRDFEGLGAQVQSY